MDRNVDQNNVGRVFKSAALNLENKGDKETVNTANALIRYEWLEALVRLARERYCKAGDRNDSVAAAFEKLINLNMIPASKHNEWQGFR